MKKKKIIKWSLRLFIIGLTTAISVFLYVWLMPHRDIQATALDFNLTSSELVQEYLDNSQKANLKYLQEEGDSKILAVTGKIAVISKDMEENSTVLLKNEGDDLGVLCYFMKGTNKNTLSLIVGDLVTIKGVIRSGAEYDEDLDLYEDAILQDCDILK